MKKIKIISLVVASLFFCTACDDYLDINKNIDAPDYVDEHLYLSAIEQLYVDLYFDITYAAAPLSQMFGTTSTNGFLTHSYPAGSDTGGQWWRTVYWKHGINLENLISQAEAKEKWTMAGIGYAIKAFDWDMLSKLHGEAPMKQAFTTGRTEFDYDYQPEIYEQARAWAYKAIEYFEKEDKNAYGAILTANDYIYKGDKAKWKKFAYAVIVKNLASLSNKKDFTTKYADELITAASKSFTSVDDDATVSIAGGSQAVPYTAYNNFWSTARANLSTTYFQHDYAVQVMTGTVPVYAGDGKREKVDIPPTHEDTVYFADYPYMIRDKQIITDTFKTVGHFDPRVVAKLGTMTGAYRNIDNIDSVKAYRFVGGYASRTGPNSRVVPNFFGRDGVSKTGETTAPNDGKGRWIYHDEAPYILTTYAELQFNLAEAYWKKGQKGNAYAAFKEGVKADLTFTAKYLKPGAKGTTELGGDKVTVAVFNTLANQYAAGPYVDGLTEGNLTLSHIMMQKWVALYPWGAAEAWVDLRKYHYEIQYTGEYPSKGNGWTDDRYVITKSDDDPNKVYSGFYLPATRDIEFKNSAFSINNDGAPCYRLRPRYNSEYVWNLKKLSELKPIPGDAPNYQCSIPWFAYPGDMPN
jgi:hypothetical protein